MTLPGLPEPRRVVLPVPSGGAAAARRAGRRRRSAAAGAALLVVGLGAGATAVVHGHGGHESLEVAEAPTPVSSPARPPYAGIVTDRAGHPLAGIAVLSADLTAVLTRTDRSGGYYVRCDTALLLAAYAPTLHDGPVRERSPGAGNYGWRHIVQPCGRVLSVVLAPGGVVTGHGRPGADVRLERLVGATGVLPGAAGPVFVTRVRPDGTWRMEGLDTGAYRLAGKQIVHVHQGRATAAP